jgi:replication factor C large subunit
MRGIRDSVAAKIGAHCHVSATYARSDLIYFFKTLFKDDDYAIGISAQLDLNVTEIAFLLDAKAGSEKVQRIYDSAQERIEQEEEHEIEIFGGFAPEAAGAQQKLFES